jgi:sulfide dehydrogenase cytochrome subunit
MVCPSTRPPGRACSFKTNTPGGTSDWRRPMKKHLAALAASAICLTAGAAAAQDARYLASLCANCHGTDGKSADSLGMPGLAGLSAPYFIEQMNAFRTGARQATVMHQLSKGFTDEQISLLADYFSKQKKN